MSGHDLKKKTQKKKKLIPKSFKVWKYPSFFSQFHSLEVPLLKVYDSSGKNQFNLNKIQPFFLQSAYWFPTTKHKEFSTLTIPPIYSISHIHMISS